MVDHIIAVIAIAIALVVALRVLNQKPSQPVDPGPPVDHELNSILRVVLGALTSRTASAPPPVAWPYPRESEPSPEIATAGRSAPGAQATGPSRPPPAVTLPSTVGPVVGGPGYEDRRTVDLMFATTRKYSDTEERFTGERSRTITFGRAGIRVPEDHLPGELERPREYSLFSFTIYRQAEDPRRHFMIRGIEKLKRDRWLEVIGAMPSSDALVFVHGFNTSFEAALFRNAQIVWDLRFKGVAVLFSWASRGAIADYFYDKESASLARKAFTEVLALLAGRDNVKQVHVLAHSMGNQVVLDALAQYRPDDAPLRLGELIMAAPDVDGSLYESLAPEAQKFTKGMTLYASAADRALAFSKDIHRGVARAGDVPAGGPIVIDSIDSIDATSLGKEMFGLNHATFARSLSILNDVQLLLGGLRPMRVIEVEGVPEGVIPPRYWRYLGPRG